MNSTEVLPDRLTKSDVKQAWRITKENKASSYSGLLKPEPTQNQNKPLLVKCSVLLTKLCEQFVRVTLA